MRSWIDRVVSLLNLATFVYQITDATCVARRGVVARAVRKPESARGVAEQWERKVVLLGKSGVFHHRVEADAEDLYFT